MSTKRGREEVEHKDIAEAKSPLKKQRLEVPAAGAAPASPSLPPADDGDEGVPDVYSDLGAFLAMIDEQPRRSPSFVLGTAASASAGAAAASSEPPASSGFAKQLFQTAKSKITHMLQAVHVLKSSVPPPILIWVDKSKNAFQTNLGAIHQFEDEGWRTSLHADAESAEAVFFAHSQHVKCLIVSLQHADLAYKLQAQAPHLVAIIWSLYASQNKDVADACRKRGAQVATNRRHLIELVQHSHPQHAPPAAAAAAPADAKHADSKGDGKSAGAGAAATRSSSGFGGFGGFGGGGGASKPQPTEETVFWIDSDGESATKNKNITDEFAKAGWVVRSFTSLGDADRAFHPFVKVVIASLAAQSLLFDLKKRSPNLKAIIWSRTASQRPDIAASCRSKGAEVPTSRDDLLRSVSDLQQRLQREALVFALHPRVGADSSVGLALNWTNKAFQTAILGRVFRYVFEESTAAYQREHKRESGADGYGSGDDDEEGDLEWTPGKPKGGGKPSAAGAGAGAGAGSGKSESKGAAKMDTGGDSDNDGKSSGKSGKDSAKQAKQAAEESGGSGSEDESGDDDEDEEEGEGDEDNGGEEAEVEEDELAGLLNDQDTDVATLRAASAKASAAAATAAGFTVGGSGSGAGSGSAGAGSGSAAAPVIAAGFSIGDYVLDAAPGAEDDDDDDDNEVDEGDSSGSGSDDEEDAVGADKKSSKSAKGAGAGSGSGSGSGSSN